MSIPDPHQKYPIEGIERTVFLNNIIDAPNVEIGNYTYYDDPDHPEGFLENVLYHFPFIGDRLVIGKFCQIASGVTFIMNGANHRFTGFSTYPFAAFGGDWANRFDGELDGEIKGDTVVGNDVWIGYDTLFMPGVTIGHGAIIGARSVVTRDVAPYTIVAGNPATPIRTRFDNATVETLLKMAWWDWPIDHITEAIPDISAGNLEALKARSDSFLDRT